MSKLLINEHPLQVLPSLACQVGLNEAIVLQQVHYWLGMNSIGKEADGRRWVRNSVREWRKENFPFWSEDTVQRTLSALVKRGALLARSDLSEKVLDRSLWYSIDYEWLERTIEEATPITASCGNRLPQVAVVDHRNLHQCSIYTETTTETTTEIAAPPPEPPPAKKKKSKPRSEAYTNPVTGVSSTDIRNTYMDLLVEYEHNAIINHAQVGAGAEALAAAGWLPDQVADCYRHLRRHDRFWDSKHLSLQSVAKQIGAYYAKSSRKPIVLGGSKPVKVFEPVDPETITF